MKVLLQSVPNAFYHLGTGMKISTVEINNMYKFWPLYTTEIAAHVMQASCSIVLGLLRAADRVQG